MIPKASQAKSYAAQIGQVFFLGLFSNLAAQEARPFLPDEESYQVSLPQHYLNSSMPGQNSVVSTDNTPSSNPTTDAGARLGRVLFYEKKLSQSETISCASCHQQAFGFSDPDRLSVGHAGESTRRNSMGLGNARFYESGKFFWDERAATLEEQVLDPIQDSVEMGLTLEELVTTVESQDYYPPLFEDAFGDSAVSSDRIARALAQFVRSLASVDSKYDGSRAEVSDPTADFPGFTDQENLGKRIFMLQENRPFSCIECHVGEAFLGAKPLRRGDSTGTTNNGIDAVSMLDFGVQEASGLLADQGKFKVPSLKNIAVTGPYMHDGRLQSLADVVRHYGAVQNHAQLSPPLRVGQNQVAQLRLNRQEQDALVAFLETLTDDILLTDPKFSDPFQPVWQPSGWLFITGDYLYEPSTASWHYLSTDPGNESLHVNLSTGEWAEMDAIAGWVYFAGEYFYDSTTSNWHYYDQSNDQWSVNLATGAWELFIR